MCGEDKPAASQTSVERSMSWAPRRPSPQFPQFWLGWNIEPPAWDRRSLLTGSSRGGPSRRYSISGNHTLPSHRGAMRSSRTRSWRTLPRTLRSRAIGGNAYRRSLGHLCTIRVQSVQFWCLELTANASRKSVSQNIKYLHLSFNQWPSIQYKLWVSLVLWNHNNGEHCWLGNGPEDDHWHPPQRG